MGKIRRLLLGIWENYPETRFSNLLESSGIQGHMQDNELSIGIGEIELHAVTDDDNTMSDGNNENMNKNISEDAGQDAFEEIETEGYNDDYSDSYDDDNQYDSSEDSN